MNFYNLTLALQTKIKTLTEYENRVYVFPSWASLVLLESYDTPLIGIVPSLGKIKPLKPSTMFDYSFDIFILEENWKDQEVVIGNTSKDGLIRLLQDLFNLLKDEMFETELSGAIHNVIVKNGIPIRDFKGKDGQALCAMIGLTVKYQEVS